MQRTERRIPIETYFFKQTKKKKEKDLTKLCKALDEIAVAAIKVHYGVQCARIMR